MKKIMVITGGSRGIGAATAQLAAKRGFSVCVNYHKNQKAAQIIVESIEQAGRKAIAVGANIGSETEVVTLFERVDEELGTVTALVNNAGILEQQMRVDQMDSVRLKRIFTTNTIGSLLCAREAIRRMSTKYGGAGGAIVNISSGAARIGSPGEYVIKGSASLILNYSCCIVISWLVYQE